MTTPIKTLLLTVVLLFGSSQAGYAQDLAKGAEAYFREDYAAALKEWRPLAEQGDARAQFSLGILYEYGQGVIEDDKEAARLYWLAAEQGYAMAQSRLGVRYANGKGVIKDMVYAHMWLNIAVSNGYEDAVNNRDIAANIMTPSQLEEATRLARECVKKEYKGC